MNKETFPIRILSEKTGVPTATIRAWERRYNILPAQRTASGHRHYTDQDVVYVGHLVARMEQGMTISKAIREVENQLQQGQTLTRQAHNTQSSQWQYHVDEILLAVAQFNTFRLNQTYQQAMALFAVDIVTEKVLCPALITLGQRWQDRPTGIAEEHFFATFLRNKIGARLHHHDIHDGPIIVMACLPGERHELGSLLFALSAQSSGYRVISLGADLPVEQIASVAEKTSASGIVLSSTSLEIDKKLIRQLDELAHTLTVPVMIGGNVNLTGMCQLPDSITTLGHQFALALDKISELIEG